MNAPPGVDLHPGAAEDIHDLWSYIVGDSPWAAERLIYDILKVIRGLPAFPHQGHRRPDLTSRPLRFKVVRDYLIAYAPEPRPIWVIAVMHGRQNPQVMASILRGREHRH
jgi:plasmid stabilization system protein ParE